MREAAGKKICTKIFLGKDVESTIKRTGKKVSEVEI
jgi:hypothetical protein